MRIVSAVQCVIYLSWQVLKFSVASARGVSLWEYLFRQTEALPSSSGHRACLAKWLLSGALVNRNPERLLRLYKNVLQNIPSLRLRNETAIAVLESAVWLQDRAVAEHLLLTLSAVIPALPSATIDRLRQLHNWRFRKDMSRAQPLLSLMSPSDYFLPYLFFLARAVIADSMDNKQDALSDYRRALALLPPTSREYSYALDRCNRILNEPATD